MGKKKTAQWPHVALMFILPLLFDIHPLAASASPVADECSRETYIVHVKAPDGQTQSEDLDSLYQSFLPSTTASSNNPPHIIYSYHNVITGFAAILSLEEVKAMEKKDGFLSAWPQRVLSLHTTHSPNFLGLHQDSGLWKSSNYGKGVIIGVLDTGILPNHPSFSDEGMPPPPAKWKGICQLNNKFSCNNKLIGVRNFWRADKSKTAIDKDGHGTHTASTAAGSFVRGANVFGNANGTAVGIAPLAHLAIYRVCSSFACADSDILAGMDAAIEDGVDVLSLSLGASSRPFYRSSIAIGAFVATQRGIFVSCSAGNMGPVHGSIANDAPWILTVGASTIDRSIRTSARLGNTMEFNGESLFQPHAFNSTRMSLVYPRTRSRHVSPSYALYCGPGSLNNKNVKRKVVLCEVGGGIPKTDKGQTVKDAGGAAMILMNDQTNGYSTQAEVHVLPATHVSYVDGLKIKTYINSTATPTAAIVLRGTIIGNNYAPMVASFSSRGPSPESPGILKPDIIGPGVNILAAWPFSVENNTDTNLTFNIISGTSMSCPHLSGIAALLKSAHLDWSPAAIKSAIMTTAYQLNLDKKPIVDQRLLPADLFAIGAGHVNPSRASDPGLVYDIQPNDYISYLCGLKYTDRQVGIVARRTVNCSKESSIPQAQLNYPSFSLTMGYDTQIYSRTVTNVGEAYSSYVVKIVPPQGVVVSVRPTRLDFSKVNQQMTYHVTFSRCVTCLNTTFAQGFLQWTSAKNVVRSPISILFSQRR